MEAIMPWCEMKMIVGITEKHGALSACMWTLVWFTNNVKAKGTTVKVHKGQETGMNWAITMNWCTFPPTGLNYRERLQQESLFKDKNISQTNVIIKRDILLVVRGNMNQQLCWIMIDVMETILMESICLTLSWCICRVHNELFYSA